MASRSPIRPARFFRTRFPQTRHSPRAARITLNRGESPSQFAAMGRQNCRELESFLASRGTIRDRRFSADGSRRSIFHSRHKGSLDAVETAPAQGRGNDSTRSLSITEAYVTAAHVAVDSHFRDERDTDTGRNHPQETAELAAFESNVRSDAGAGAGPNAEVSETVSVTQHNERFSAEIFEGKRFCGGARMVSSHHSEEGLRADRKQL